MSDTTFKTRFKALTGHEPFPWQIELFEKWFAKGQFPPSCNLPTGLGKTLIVAIWLIALMDQPGKIRVCPTFYTLYLYQNCAVYEYL